MPRYLIPFVKNSNWKSNKNCIFCSTIDQKYNEIASMNNDNDKQKTLLFLESLLTDGYKLLNVFEMNGYAISLKNEIERIKLYPSNNDLFMHKVWNVLYPNNQEILPNDQNIDVPILIHSRWCNHCGSRKPDIYNSDRQDNLNLLDINNFYITYDNNIVKVSWEDIFSVNWHGVKLVRTMDAVPIDVNGGITLIDSKLRNQFTINNPFIDNNNFEPGHVYYYRLFVYDANNITIKISNVLEVYVPENNNIPPDAINDLTLKQIREIQYYNGVYRNVDCVLANWTDPKNNCDGTELRFSNRGIPSGPEDGFRGFDKNLIDVSKQIYNKLYIGELYYFKTFPYDTVKYKFNPDGPGYEPYRNYQNDSTMKYIEIKPPIGNVTNLQVKMDDAKIKISWNDPDDLNWTATKILYKKDSIILNENDGDLFFILNEKNRYSVDELEIDNLQNNEIYYIGIFPIDDNGICNVSIENQIKIIPEYYVSDKIINFNDNDNFKFTYLGNWKLIQLDNNNHALQSPILKAGKIDLCYLEITDVRYGGTINFDYKSDILEKYDRFSVYINYNLAFTTDKVSDWKTIELKIPSGDYCNIRFEFDKNIYPNDLISYVLINNIKIRYNSFRNED